MSATHTQISLPTIMWVLILFLATLAHITADIYLPSLPTISQYFHSSDAASQLTLSVFLFGFAVSHLFYGPLSDRLGRKKPMLLGVGLSIVGGIVCTYAPNIEVLILGRFIQGCGVGASNTIIRSVIRDLFSGTQLSKIGSQLGMMMVVMTAMAPTVGGYLEDFFSWRGTFFFLAGYTLCIWLLVFFRLPETNKQLDHTALNAKVILKNYGTLLTHRMFMGYAICMSTAYAGILVYLTQAPFLLQNIAGLTPVEFGWTSFLIGSAFFTSFLFNNHMVVKKGIPWMVGVGISCIVLASTLFILGGLFQWVNAVSILAPITLYAFGCGLSFSNASAGALHPFTQNVGVAAALFGFIQVIAASVMSSLTTLLVPNTQLPLGMILLMLGLVALGSWRWLVRSL